MESLSVQIFAFVHCNMNKREKFVVQMKSSRWRQQAKYLLTPPLEMHELNFSVRCQSTISFGAELVEHLMTMFIMSMYLSTSEQRDVTFYT